MLPTKKIRVLQCIRQGQIGGGETHLLTLVQNIDRTKYQPIILSFTDGPMVTKLAEMNFRTHVIHSEKPFDTAIWKKVKALLLHEEIELVHCHGTRAMSNVFKPARSLKIPIIYSIHGWSFHDDQNSLVKRIKIWIEQFLTSRANVNISVSESNMQSGKKLMPFLKAIVINNGIDQFKFNPGQQFKNIRQEIKVDVSAILLIFIARFTAHKQPLSLIKAFSGAIKHKPALHLLMVGEGDQTNKALQMVKEMGIENNIHFLPFRQDVPDLLAAADIFILPSLWEGLPIGLIEAMSMGKAVIATNVDGSKEIVKDRQNGLLIDTNGLVENLTKAILELNENESLRKILSENAIKTVRADYDAALMTRKIESVYANLLK
jgi:glycosyltransferase involved in cell wall biosynthesis